MEEAKLTKGTRMTETRVFTVEEAHVKGWCHDGSVCTNCLESRAKVIAQLEADGNFELLWKHYR